MPRTQTAEALAPKPVTVQIELEAPAPESPKRRYWIGTMPDSPVQNITLGGVTFHRYVGKFERADGSIDPRTPRGDVVWIDDTRRARIEREVKSKLLRVRGGRRVVVSRITPPQREFRAMPGDEPLAYYVYMVELPEGVSRPDGEPTPMAERNAEAAATAAA